MRNIIRPFTIPVAMLVAMLAPTAHAQLEYFNTINSYSGEGIVGFTGGNTALTETMTNILELNSVTYQITNTGSPTVSQNIDAYLVQWNTGTDTPKTTFAAPTTIGGNDVTTTISTSPIASFTVPPVGTGAWTTDTFAHGGTYNGYDISLNLNQLLDPSLTYGIILIDTTNASGLGLLNVNVPSGQDTFAGQSPFTPYGGALQDQGDSTLVAMQNDPGASYTGGRTYANYGFSQIAVVPNGNIIPSPEPRTAAVALCGLFVAFLVGRQLYLNRKSGDGLATASFA